MSAYYDAAAMDAWITGNGDAGQTDAEIDKWECGCGELHEFDVDECEDCGDRRPDMEEPEPDDDEDRTYDGPDQTDMRCFHADGSVSYHD